MGHKCKDWHSNKKCVVCGVHRDKTNPFMKPITSQQKVRIHSLTVPKVKGNILHIIKKTKRKEVILNIAHHRWGYSEFSINDLINSDERMDMSSYQVGGYMRWLCVSGLVERVGHRIDQRTTIGNEGEGYRKLYSWWNTRTLYRVVKHRGVL